MPFRIQFKTDCAIPLSTWVAHAEENAQRPRVTLGVPKGKPLAIVGGSPSIALDLEELRAWPGDIWAINYTANYLHAQGIPCALFTVDPGDPVDPGPWDSPVRKRLLATSCPSSMFTEDSLAFDMVETHSQGFAGGTSSATRAPWIALSLGYLDVSFFGCDCSYETQDHADRHEGSERELIIRAGGQDYRTRPDFLVQCEEFAKLFTEFGSVFKNRSRGLVRAMLENPDTWEVVGVSPAMKAHLEEHNGRSGLYDTPFQPLGEAA
jgi:hypothetical protein